MKRLIRIICLMVIAIGLSSCAILYPSDVYERDGVYHHTHSVIYHRQPHYYHHHHHTPPSPKHRYTPVHPPQHKDNRYGKPSKPAPKPQRPSTPPRRPSNGTSRPTPYRR